MAFKLSEMRDQLVPEGADLDIYFEVFQPPGDKVDVELQAHYDDDQGNRTSKAFKLKDLTCTPVRARSGDASAHAFTVRWKANLTQFPELAGRVVQAVFVVGQIWSPDTYGIVSIDVTQQPELTRIMLHEFSKIENGQVVFDDKELKLYLDTLTAQQRRTLLNTAQRHADGRLVTFVTLYQRKDLRMNSDFTKDPTHAGVVPNATFSVFHCRDTARSRGVTPKATSPITLICHTRYFVVNLNHVKTSEWITKQKYDGRTPNQWLSKDTDKPLLFKIGALKPTAEVSNGVIWHAIHEASGINIMPGNSVHGMINTIGCWMLFRNYNWPLSVTKKFDQIYRKDHRAGLSEAVVAGKLATEGYNVAQKTAENSSSYEKFLNYDRNWAYQWFIHEVVGIKYFSNKDRWGHEETANDYKVDGRTMEPTFPLKQGRRVPAYNDREEIDYAYHNFAHAKLPVDNSLFRTNALGFKSASAFIETMDATLKEAELKIQTWSDLYFFKEEGVNAEAMTRDHIREP